MSDAEVATALTRGPRGLRTLLEFALRSERAVQPHPRKIGRLDKRVYDAAMRREDSVPHAYVRRLPFLRSTLAPLPPEPSLEEIAALIEALPLLDPLEDVLRSCVADAVTTARYWQGMAGEDVLASTPPVSRSLERVGEHLSRSPLVHSWFSGIATDHQQRITWDEEEPTTMHDGLGYEANALRDLLEQRQEWRADARTGGTSTWWTTPHFRIEGTAGVFADGVPIHLWLVEDDFGYDRAHAQPLEGTRGRRFVEIRSEQDWTDLCREHPVVPMQDPGGNWHACTGADGPWVMPDWASVARTADGVHLSLGAYLDLAGRPLEVRGIEAPPTLRSGRDAPRTALSIVAGWHPDTTYWLHEAPRPAGQPEAWHRIDVDGAPGELSWTRDRGARG
ncbi:hypothetical protein I8D64_06270 [Brachybacterium sp. MASK1Z-5]|uniref:Uncharacterized protein n=1 Tax=Brachybacterium halotolerans TaxID=2795215 RepID=A0ABS1B8S0_9MICO|nr:hypothetical protein [Brachybacterium halotolerans]MBK0331005.1 hypothetical protein [Brachybacterium halotolerans]